MRLPTLFGISFGILTLFAVSTCDARVNFGFGVNLEQPRCTYVQEYYYPTERVIIQQDPYGRTISEHVYVTHAPVRTVQPRPAYRPNLSFSFGFFR
ncbi:MAG: hypothetical protein H0U49_07970 [Parachlamydiaceae bacterium]|nr:hypothetical protein [Parachlamydiaceae bacterium]